MIQADFINRNIRNIGFELGWIEISLGLNQRFKQDRSGFSERIGIQWDSTRKYMEVSCRGTPRSSMSRGCSKK